MSGESLTHRKSKSNTSRLCRRPFAERTGGGAAKSGETLMAWQSTRRSSRGEAQKNVFNADPCPAQLLSRRDGRSAAAERIENNVAFVRRCLNNAFEKRDGRLLASSYEFPNIFNQQIVESFYVIFQNILRPHVRSDIAIINAIKRV